MNNFPDNLTKQSCRNLRKTSQIKLMELVREKFYAKIILDAENSKRNSTLDFPKNLYRKNRLIICKELYERFDTAKIELDSPNPYSHNTDPCGIVPLSKGFFDANTVNEFFSSNTYKNANIKNIKLFY